MNNHRIDFDNLDTRELRELLEDHRKVTPEQYLLILKECVIRLMGEYETREDQENY